MQRYRDTLNNYGRFWREEPLGRLYSVASFVDDLGIAASLWASQLIMTRIYATQEARAQVMIPMIVCLIIGTLLGGPLADSFSRNTQFLPRKRWAIVLVIRILETLALGYLTWQISLGTPTVNTIIPYAIVSGLLKALIRPTRQAFEVDILSASERLRVGGAAKEILVKAHLATSTSLRELSGTLAGIGGIAIGGTLVSIVRNRVWILFAIDVITNVAFILIVFTFCNPSYKPASYSAPSVPTPRFRWRDMRASLAPRIAAVAGLGLLVAAVNEAYDGKMILMHIIRVSDDSVRFSELGWQGASIAAIVLLPRFGSADQVFSKLFPLLVALDGGIIVAAGATALTGMSWVFTAVLAVDRFVTTLALYVPILVILDGTSGEQRGRVLAAYILCGLIASLGAQQGAVLLTRLLSVPQMMLGLGIAQAAVALALLPFFRSAIRRPKAEPASAWS